jgi:hypothetical protein
MSRTFDGHGNFSLMHGTCAGDASSFHLPMLGHHRTKTPEVFIVNRLYFIDAKLAYFGSHTAKAARCAATLTTMISITCRAWRILGGSHNYSPPGINTTSTDFIHHLRVGIYLMLFTTCAEDFRGIVVQVLI